MKISNSVKKTAWQHIKDFIFAPLRFLVLPDDISEKLGLTSLEQERLSAVLPHIKGRLLDIGAGRNRLVQVYGNGIGIDVRDRGGGAMVVDDTSKLPFADKSFNTITFIASLNHIPYRIAVLIEAYRLLKDNGVLMVTMINPVIGFIGHKLWWYSEEKSRKVEKGELYGMWPSEVKTCLKRAGFEIVKVCRFDYGLNHLYITRKAIKR